MNLDEIVAYCCIGIAVVIFGTNFIPVKKIATGDGLFFQALVYHILSHFCHTQAHLWHFLVQHRRTFAALNASYRVLRRFTAKILLNHEKVNSLRTYMVGGTCNLLFSPDL